MDATTVLTWQALRAAATYNVLNPAGSIVITRPSDQTVLADVQQTRWIVDPPVPIVPEAGSVLFARDAWRAPWRSQLTALPHQVVLVSAFNDVPIKAVATQEMFTGSIRRWFGAQCATRHAQLVRMPVGIDARMVPVLQRATARPPNERDIDVLVNFNVNRPGRFEALAYWTQRPDATVLRWDRNCVDHYADALGRAKFVVSPPGHAWDCYRTYEAITMGAIPIVLKQPPISDVCLGLPVLMVDRWDEATPNRLRWECDAKHFSNAFSYVATLTAAYWLTRIQQAATACTELAMV